MTLVKSLVSGFVGYVEDDQHREVKLETGQEFDADSVIVQARPELFTSAPFTAEQAAGRTRKVRTRQALDYSTYHEDGAPRA